MNVRNFFPLLLACIHGEIFASQTLMLELETTLVPGPVEYAILVPDGDFKGKELPLVLSFHGGGGSRKSLLRQKGLWEALWSSGEIPDAIVVMPSVSKRGFYMNFKSGRERWEDFLLGPFLDHLRSTLPVSKDPKRTFVMGVSMGGMGALRMAFRHPDKFGAVAALEPGIEPVLKWQDIKPKHRFWREDELFENAYGKPVDPVYWAQNNPASMAVNGAGKIRESELQIYFEAGDEDQFWLYEGAEFLHQILWQQRIKHEYHLIRGADHIGSSLRSRSLEAIKFLFRSYDPWDTAPIKLRAAMKFIELKKIGLEEKDHYSETN